MPYSQSFPLGGTGDILMELVQRVEVLEARARALQNGAINVVDSNNQTRAIYGQMSNGDYGLEIWDGNGHVVNRQDAQGFHSYNTAGQEEVRAGQLNSSPAIYGLGVAPAPGAALQENGGYVNAFPTAADTVSNTSYAAFSGGSKTVTCVNGAVVFASAAVTTSAANVVGMIGVQVDSGAWSNFGSCYSTAGGMKTTLTNMYAVVAGAGSHTFTMGYNTSGGGNCSFDFPVLMVYPY